MAGTKVKVLEGWQVKHDGKLYKGGQTITGARQAEVQQWVSAGWVTEVKESKPKSTSKPQTASTKGASKK